MKIYILDKNGNNRFFVKPSLFLSADLSLDLDKLSSLKLRFARNVNKLVFDYLYNTPNVGIRIQDDGLDIVLIKGNSEVKSDGQDIGEFNFFGSFYDIAYKKVNYLAINTLVTGQIQTILQTIAPNYNFQYIGINNPTIEINIGAMDNLNLFNEVMKRGNCQWREIGNINSQVTIQYGDFDYIEPEYACYDYLKIDNIWNNNKIKISSWAAKDNSWRYDYVRFFLDKGSGTEGTITFDDTVSQYSGYPVVNIGSEVWVQNGINPNTNPKFVTKVINIPDSENLSTESVKQILYENAISFFESTDDGEEIQVELQTQKILLAGDKLLLIINKNQQQKRFLGTLRNVKYDIVNKKCTAQLVANPRKNLRSTNQSLLYNIKNESYTKKYTPIN